MHFSFFTKPSLFKSRQYKWERPLRIGSAHKQLLLEKRKPKSIYSGQAPPGILRLSCPFVYVVHPPPLPSPEWPSPAPWSQMHGHYTEGSEVVPSSPEGAPPMFSVCPTAAPSSSLSCFRLPHFCSSCGSRSLFVMDSGVGGELQQGICRGKRKKEKKNGPL